MKKFKIALSTAPARAVEARELRPQFERLRRSFEAGQVELRAMPNGLTLLRLGSLRAVGVAERATLTIHAVFQKGDLEHAINKLPRGSIQEYEFKKIRSGKQIIYENPPSKRKKPLIDKKFRKEINTLFGKKAGDLLIASILTQGVHGWIEVVKFLAGGIKWISPGRGRSNGVDAAGDTSVSISEDS